MTDKVAAPTPPGWANERTVVLGEATFVGPVAERGDRLYAGLVNLLQVSLVKTFGDLRAGARSNDQLASFLELYEENRAFESEIDDVEAVLDEREDVQSDLIDWYVEVLPAPWIRDGGAGWEIDDLVAQHGSVSGASPGGNADWMQFNMGVEELAAQFRDVGFDTVRVPSRVFEQFLGFPVDGVWLDEGEPLIGSESGQV